MVVSCPAPTPVPLLLLDWRQIKNWEQLPEEEQARCRAPARYRTSLGYKTVIAMVTIISTLSLVHSMFPLMAVEVVGEYHCVSITSLARTLL